MEVQITKVLKEQQELVSILCHEVTDEVMDIANFVKSRQGQISGTLEGKEYELSLSDIYYFESVDNRTYLYTKDKVYESRQKLYELESMLEGKKYLRVSKSIVLNLMKVDAIKPALNGRMQATLISGEDIIISRKYVSALREKLRGGK